MIMLHSLAPILKVHVTHELESIDRMYLNVEFLGSRLKPGSPASSRSTVALPLPPAH